MALGLTQPLTEISTRFISGGVKGLGASNSWNSQDIPRPVMGLLYNFTPKKI